MARRIAFRSERHAANDVAQRGAEENREQVRSKREDHLEETLPDGVFDVGTELDADGAQHQQPQHHHQRQIEAAEAGGVEQRKGKVQRAAGRQQPDFVAVPHRTDARSTMRRSSAVFATSRVDRTRAEVESVKHHVGGQHHCDEHEPERCHRSPSSGTPARRPVHSRFRAEPRTGTECPAPCTFP